MQFPISFDYISVLFIKYDSGQKWENAASHRLVSAKIGVCTAAIAQLRYHAPLHRSTRITNTTMLEKP